MFNNISKLDKLKLNAFFIIDEWPYPCFIVWFYNCVQYVKLDKSFCKTT